MIRARQKRNGPEGPFLLFNNCQQCGSVGGVFDSLARFLDIFAGASNGIAASEYGCGKKRQHQQRGETFHAFILVLFGLIAGPAKPAPASIARMRGN
ncbi:hypothetical protein ABB29_08765 [Pseudoxanthomonas dokdonensis]|uniref:Uncharacterized protein n=1 Tax=Pseudoxanthomonas dokdonensis TaxID=344882 RepID=A0A0R0CTC8_9GAMM|nr:hypothetical protein ABB29_08765 [Pseudoxanthomonas dokdonensis]